MITHKQLLPKNLHTYGVLLEDKTPLSDIFVISQFPDIFTSGKNSFFIKGSEELDPGTEVLVEILDVNGNPIFNTPIKNYEESLSRIISVEIYEDTPIGIGQITILGRLRRMPDGSSIPDIWKDNYNVKWSQRVFIDGRIVNTTPIKLYTIPTIEVSEILNPYRANSTILTSSIGTTGVTGSTIIQPLNVNNYQHPITLLRSSESLFTKEMERGTIKILTNFGTSFTSSIVRVWNNLIAELSSSFVSGTIYSEFLAVNYQIEYQSNPSYQTSQLTRSFADITISDMKTFAGDIEKIKVFVRSIDSPGDYEIISDNIVQPISLTTTQSISTAEPLLNYGYIKNQSILNSYWTFGDMSSINY